MFLRDRSDLHVAKGERCWRRTVIEPIPKAVEAMSYEMFCCAKVEPRVDCGIVNLE